MACFLLKRHKCSIAVWERAERYFLQFSFQVFLFVFVVFESHFCDLSVLLLVEGLILGVRVSGVGIPVVIRLVVAHVRGD